MAKALFECATLIRDATTSLQSKTAQAEHAHGYGHNHYHTAG